MSNLATISSQKVRDKRKKRKKNSFLHEIKKNKVYYLMALPAIIYFIIFSYMPMSGLVVAFKDYNYKDGIFGSKWIGFKNFEFFFNSNTALKTTFNTLFINANYIFWGTILAIFFAIIINEIRHSFSKKIYQSLTFLPYFFSAVVVANFVYMIFSENLGIANELITFFGGNPVEWYQNSKHWVPILVGVHLWKNTGYSMIIYLATIVGIDEELYEAAKVAGANRFQQIRYITLPFLVPTISVLTLLAIGRIFYGDFGTIYAIIKDNGQLFPTTEIIDTYVFRAVKGAGEISMPAAVGLYQAICGFILVMGSNLITKKMNNAESLF